MMYFITPQPFSTLEQYFPCLVFLLDRGLTRGQTSEEDDNPLTDGLLGRRLRSAERGEHAITAVRLFMLCNLNHIPVERMTDRLLSVFQVGVPPDSPKVEQSKVRIDPVRMTTAKGRDAKAIGTLVASIMVARGGNGAQVTFPAPW